MSSNLGFRIDDDDVSTEIPLMTENRNRQQADEGEVWNGRTVKLQDSAKPPYAQACGLLNSIFCFPWNLCFCGYFEVRPNESAIVYYGGKPTEVVSEPGTHRRNPACLEVQKVSLALHSRKTNVIEVNDGRGNSIHIAGEYVWKVKDPFLASTSTSSPIEDYIKDQAHVALRSVAAKYPYDVASGDTSSLCLRLCSERINLDLTTALQDLVGHIGVVVNRFRLTTVGYTEDTKKLMVAPQIAQRELDAKNSQVQSVVGIVTDVISGIQEKLDIQFDNQHKQEMAANITYMLLQPTGTKVSIIAGNKSNDTTPFVTT